MERHWQGVVLRVYLMGLLVLLLLACAKAENKTWPTANQNLSPVEGWRSAEYCLQKTSIVCPKNQTLKDSGWLNITKAEGPTFCAVGGCADHTKKVLLCIHHVKRDYKFANGATTQDLYDTIDLGCNSPQGFTGVSKYSTSDGNKLKLGSILVALSSAVFTSMALM